MGAIDNIFELLTNRHENFYTIHLLYLVVTPLQEKKKIKYICSES